MNTIAPPKPSLEAICSLISAEMEALDSTIVHQLHSDVALVGDIGQHIIKGGGKRIRPMLVILCALTCGYQGQQHIDLAAIVEFIHTATLLHDDVVDISEMRRGNKTANALWGNAASVLVGDFVYSRAFQMMAKLKHLKVMEVMADTTNVIAEGEVLQLMNQKNPNITEQDYFDVIHFKTAKLFEAACMLGGIIADAPRAQQQALKGYGFHLGMAYQIIDDMLDYSGDPEKLGKNIGDDLAEGKTTLPLIFAMQRTDTTKKKLIQDAIAQGKVESMPTILTSIKETDALTGCRQTAEAHINQAIKNLTALNDSEHLSNIRRLTTIITAREH